MKTSGWRCDVAGNQMGEQWRERINHRDLSVRSGCVAAPRSQVQTDRISHTQNGQVVVS
jgi:hypothetical protein